MDKYMGKYPFYHRREKDKIWWVRITDRVGYHLFSFDKEKVYNLFADYPHNLTPEEKALFDKENPFWAKFFKSRPYPPKKK